MDGELTYQAWATNYENELPKIKPCPFCGGEVKTAVITFDEKFYEPPYEAWYLDHADIVAASEEHCPIPTTDTFYDTEAEAIAAWNTRAERTCKVAASYSPSDMNEQAKWYFAFTCGCELYWDESEPPNYCPNCGAKVVD